MGDAPVKIKCPDCGHDMVLREGRYGQFFGCSTYPACKGAHKADGKGAPVGAPASQETRLQRRKVLAVLKGVEQVYRLGQPGAVRMLSSIAGYGPDLLRIGEMNAIQCAELLRRWATADRTQVESAIEDATKLEEALSEAHTDVWLSIEPHWAGPGDWWGD